MKNWSNPVINFNYTEVSKNLLNLDISSNAKILYIYIKSKPSNYIFYQKNISFELNWKRTKTTSSIKELKDHDLLKIENNTYTIKSFSTISSFVKVPNNLILFDMNSNIKLLLIHLLGLNKTINYKYLSKIMKVTEKTISSYMKQLSELGFINITKRTYKKTNKFFYIITNKIFASNKTINDLNISEKKPTKKQIKYANKFNLNTKNETRKSLSKKIKSYLYKLNSTPTEKQIKFALSKGINFANLTRKQLSDKIHETIKYEAIHGKYREPIWEKIEIDESKVLSVTELEALL